MSFMGKLFGSGRKEKPKSTGEAIQSLREAEEMLLKRQEYLEKKLESELTTARKHAKSNKRLALQALKRKKRLEQELTQLDGMLTTIENQQYTLQGANTATQVLQTMSEGAKALKAAHNNMDVDKVHDLMDDIAEQQDVAKEISEAISNPVAFGQDFDEDELEAELNALEEEGEREEQEALEKELLKVTPPSANVVAPEGLPDVPNAELPKAEKSKKKLASEDDDMAELAAWAS